MNEDAVEAIAQKALDRKTGARGLRSIVEGALLDIMYELPSVENIESCTVTKDCVLKGKKPVLTEKQEKSNTVAS